jgi:hypothetical protein
MVLSKDRVKRSRGKSKGSTSNKRARKSDGKSDLWITQACELFKGITWQRAGYEVIQDATGEEHVDKHAPIFRCVCCGAMTGRLSDRSHVHKPTCALNSLLLAQNHRADPPQTATPIQQMSAPSASLQLCLDGNLASDADPDATPNTMAQDLQDILNIPASSFKWLEEELADEDDLLSQYSEETPNSRVSVDLIRQQDPSLIRFLLILARLCQRLRELDEGKMGLGAATGSPQQRRHGPPLSTHLSPPLLLLCMLFRLCAREKETRNSHAFLMKKLCQQATHAVRRRHVHVVSASVQPANATARSA